MVDLRTASADPSMPSDGIRSSRLTAHVEALGKASRRSAVIGGFGLAILTGSLALAAWRLEKADSKARAVEAQVAERRAQLDRLERQGQEMQTTLSQRQAALESVSKEVDANTTQLDAAKKQLTEIQELISKSKDVTLLKQVQTVAPFRTLASMPIAPSVPLEAVSRVALAVAPTGRTVGDLPLYDVRYSVNVPKDRILDVLKVEYFFDHSSFVPQRKTSFDAGSGFALKYLGWGCIRSVKVTLVGRDGGRHELPPFDMCASGGWTQRNAAAH